MIKTQTHPTDNYMANSDDLVLADHEDNDDLILLEEDSDDDLNLLAEDDRSLVVAENNINCQLDELPLNAYQPREFPSVWKLMLVDDEPEIHQVTRLVLDDFTFDNKAVDIISAYSGDEAKRLLKKHPDTAIIFLDVVMEEQDTGLQFVKYVRETLTNRLVRIVLRTGQPGEAPEESVIREYDINDYTLKMELSYNRFSTVVISALRSYRDLLIIQAKQFELEQINQQLQAEIEERKRLEIFRLEKERLRLEKEMLETLNANKDKLFSILAHDLKGPFFPLLHNSELLATQAKRLARSEIEELGQSLYNSAKGVFELLENLLQWSRLQRGHVAYQPNKLNLLHLFTHNVELFKPAATNKNIGLFHRLEAMVFIQADQNMIDLILRNLINNAIKFTKPGGRIEVSAQLHERNTTMVEISVSDTGVGIREDMIPNLFQVGEHYTMMGTAHEKGTGLGLIICKEMIDKHQGKIWVESQMGVGTTFKFTVPVVEPLPTGQWLTDITNSDISMIELNGNPKQPTFSDVPSHNELVHLNALIQRGNIRKIQKWAQQLKQTEVQYQPFCDEVIKLAKLFDGKALTELIEQYL